MFFQTMKTNLENPAQVLKALNSGSAETTALIIGDCMLDRYIWGSVRRVSPEAPVPVVFQLRETFSGGGAAELEASGGEISLIPLAAGHNFNLGSEETGSAIPGMALSPVAIAKCSPTAQS